MLGIELAAATMQPVAGGRQACVDGAFNDNDRVVVGMLLRGELEHATDADVLDTAIRTVGVLELGALVDGVLLHTTDESAEVREASAWTLGLLDPGELREQVAAALVALADDPVGDVRNWALSGLGSPFPIDTPDTRAAFRRHVDDPDEEAQCEAILALAVLGDVEMLVAALERYEVGREVVEAAERAADPRLCKPLVALRVEGWARTVDDEVTLQLETLLDAAVTACCRADPSSGRRAQHDRG